MSHLREKCLNRRTQTAYTGHSLNITCRIHPSRKPSFYARCRTYIDKTRQDNLDANTCCKLNADGKVVA